MTGTEQIQEDVKRMVADLQEKHLVNVQVFVTWKDGNKCFSFDHGNGDWYSRFGFVVEWVVMQKERARLAVRPSDKDDGSAGSIEE